MLDFIMDFILRRNGVVASIVLILQFATHLIFIHRKYRGRYAKLVKLKRRPLLSTT